MTIFTSLYPSVHRVNNWRYSDHPHISILPHNFVTVTEILKNAGYLTAAFTDGSNVDGDFGFSRGFDSYRDDFHFWKEPFKGVYPWLERHHQKKFFLFLHTYEAHWPYLPPEPFDRMYGPDYNGDILSTRKEVESVLVRKPKSGRSRFARWDLSRVVKRGVNPKDPRDIRHLKALYDGGIRYVDTQFEKLLSFLESHELLRDTLLIFTSDHGEELHEHGTIGQHRTLYDENLRVPLILAWPGQLPQGKVLKDQVRLIDLSPTILDLLKIHVPEEMEGESLVPFFEGRAKPRRAFSEREMKNPGGMMHKVSIRENRWKLIGRYDKKLELYDLDRDPQESRNLSAKTPERTAYYLDHLSAWRASLPRSEAFAMTAEIGKKDGGVEQQLKKFRALGYLQ